MGAYRISTPVPEFTGEVGGLAFAKGVYEGEVPDGPLAYFTAQGYTVEPLDEAPDEAEAPAEDEAADKAPAKPATKAAAAKTTDGGESK